MFQIFQRNRSQENGKSITFGSTHYIFPSSFKWKEMYVQIQFATGCNLNIHVGMLVCRQVYTHIQTRTDTQTIGCRDLRLGNYFPGFQAMLPNRCAINTLSAESTVLVSSNFQKRRKSILCISINSKWATYQDSEFLARKTANHWTNTLILVIQEEIEA